MRMPCGMKLLAGVHLSLSGQLHQSANYKSAACSRAAGQAHALHAYASCCADGKGCGCRTAHFLITRKPKVGMGELYPEMAVLPA